MHGRKSRVGGVAEWPSIKLTVNSLKPDQPVEGCTSTKIRPARGSTITCEPIAELTVDVKVPHPVARIISGKHGELDWVKLDEILAPGTVRVKLPLEWTDIVRFLPE